MSAPGLGELRVGVGLPNFGDALQSVDPREIARAVEDAGFDSLWLTDHILLPEHFESKYPFSTDGTFFLPKGGSWYEPLVTLAYVAGATRTVRLGVGVCVVALRDPRVFSQQVAAVDRLVGGRVVLGAGSGWLREEFEALEIPFGDRGARLDGAIDLMRECWTGRPRGGQYGPYRLPDGFTANPTPVQERVPILLAGEGQRALDRMVERGDGWYGASGIGQLVALDVVGRVRDGLAERCAAVGRSFAEMVLALRIAIPTRELGSDSLAETLTAYRDAGVSQVTIDFSWRSLAQGQSALQALAGTVERVHHNSGARTAGGDHDG